MDTSLKSQNLIPHNRCQEDPWWVLKGCNMFLLIENKNVSPVEGFTVLGLSTSRGTDKIGQFGSGAKHGILSLLRHNINPYIYLGEKELVFYTTPAKVAEKDYNEVYYFYDGKKEKLSYCLEFGELDWDDVTMALREFISNAIDNGEYSVDVTQVKEGREGYTRVYIPWSTDIQKYYTELNWRFLHFQKKEDIEFIRKDELSPPKIYRKGVYVRTIDTKDPSLFDYNFSDIKIDECRNLDDYKARAHIGKHISQSMIPLEEIFKSFTQGQKYFEHTLSQYYMKATPVWEEAWNKIYANGIPCSGDAHIIEKLRRKGHIPVIIPYEYLEILRNTKIKTYFDAISNVEMKGATMIHPCPDSIKLVNKYWNILEKMGLTKNKEIPAIKFYNNVMDGGEVVLGFYENDTIYLSSEARTNQIVILEELSHHITGSTDLSRDFQDFVLRVAVTALKVKHG